MPVVSRAIALLLPGVLAAAALGDADHMAADAATAARLHALHQASARLASVQADVLTRTHLPPRHTVGRVVLRGADAYYRVAEVVEGTERVAQESVVTASAQWTLNYEAGLASHVDMTRLRAAAPHLQVPNNALDALDTFARAEAGSVRYLGPTVRDGIPLDRFRIVAGIGDAAPGELLVWVGPDDGVPRRVELWSPTGRLLLERDFVNVKVDAPIPDAVFALTVPPDMTVRDLTDEYLAREAE